MSNATRRRNVGGESAARQQQQHQQNQQFRNEIGGRMAALVEQYPDIVDGHGPSCRAVMCGFLFFWLAFAVMFAYSRGIMVHERVGDWANSLLEPLPPEPVPPL